MIAVIALLIGILPCTFQCTRRCSGRRVPFQPAPDRPRAGDVRGPEQGIHAPRMRQQRGARKALRTLRGRSCSAPSATVRAVRPQRRGPGRQVRQREVLRTLPARRTATTSTTSTTACTSPSRARLLTGRARPDQDGEYPRPSGVIYPQLLRGRSFKHPVGRLVPHEQRREGNRRLLRHPCALRRSPASVARPTN